MVVCERCGADLEPYDYLTHGCVREGPDVLLRVVRADGRVEWYAPTADVVLGPGDRMAPVPAADAPPGAVGADTDVTPDGNGTTGEGPA